jgi:hypothetical protein
LHQTSRSGPELVRRVVSAVVLERRFLGVEGQSGGLMRAWIQRQ